jgi:hypothetical protein
MKEKAAHKAAFFMQKAPLQGGGMQRGFFIPGM